MKSVDVSSEIEIRISVSESLKNRILSSTSVYHHKDGSWVTEESECLPQNFRGRIMLQAEQLFLSSGFKAQVVRAAGIYGPGRGRLLEMIKQKQLTLPPAASVYQNRIHVKDLARMLLFIAENDFEQQIFNAVDQESSDKREVLSFLSEKLSVKLAEGEPGSVNKRISNGLVTELGFTFDYPTYREGYSEMIP